MASTLIETGLPSLRSVSASAAVRWCPPVYASDNESSQTAHPGFHELLANARRQAARGDFHSARRLAETARELRPNSPWLHEMLGDIAREYGDEQMAACEYQRALELDDSLIAANLGMARSLRALGLESVGLKYLSKAISQLEAMDADSLLLPYGVTAGEALNTAKAGLPWQPYAEVEG